MINILDSLVPCFVSQTYLQNLENRADFWAERAAELAAENETLRELIRSRAIDTIKVPFGGMGNP